MLTYWFLAVSVLVAALLARTWREHPAPVVRTVLAAVAATMLLSGLLMHLHQLRGLDRHQLLSAEEVQLADEVRRRTPPHAVFAVGLQRYEPVTMLAGRPALIGFPPWLFTWGIDYAERERDLRTIYALTAEAPALMDKYGVDYVLIGPNERRDLHANVDGYRARYPCIIRTKTHEVFAVGEVADCRLRRQR